MNCSYGGPSVSIVGCSGSEQGCRSVATTVTYPEAAVSASILCSNPGAGGWCLGAASLEITSSEPVPGFNILTVEGTRNGETFACTGSTCSVPLLEGVNNLTFWALSSWGDSSGMGTAAGMVDTQPPYIGGALSGAAGSGGWFVSPVEVSASASDATSGIGSIVYSLDGSGQTSYSGPFTVGDGIHTIVFTATDVAGNSSSTTVNVNVDLGLPSLAIDPPSGTPGAGGWFLSSASLSASASDGGSGLAALEYSVDGGSPTPYAGPVSIGDGSHTVVFTATDRAGNSVSGSTTVNVDTQAPQLSLSGTATYCPACGGTMPIDYSVSDSASGVTVWTLMVDGNTLAGGTAAESGTFDWDGSGLPAGAHTIALVARDLAGNLTQTEISVTLTVPPSPEEPTSRPAAVRRATPTPTATATTASTAADSGAGGSGSAATATDTGGRSSAPTATRTNAVVAFNNYPTPSGDNSTITTITTPTPLSTGNILFGAAAAAVIGATTAYVLEQRRKRKEEEAHDAYISALVNQAQENRERQELADYINRTNFKKMLDAAQEVGVSQEKIEEYKELYRQGKYNELNKAVKADMQEAINENLPNLLMAAEHSPEAKKYIQENILCYSESYINSVLYSNLTPEAQAAARYSPDARRWIEDPADDFKNLKSLQIEAIRRNLAEMDAWARTQIPKMMQDARDLGTPPEKMAVLERLSETMSPYAFYQVLLNNNLEMLPGYTEKMQALYNRKLYEAISALPPEYGAAASHSPEAAKWIAENLEKLWEQEKEEAARIAKLELEKARGNDPIYRLINWYGKNIIEPIRNFFQDYPLAGVMLPSIAISAFLAYPVYQNIANDPAIFDNVRAQWMQQVNLLQLEHPAMFADINTKWEAFRNNPYNAISTGMDFGNVVANTIAGYADTALQASPVAQAIAGWLRLAPASRCSELLGEGLWRLCATPYNIAAGFVENPFDTMYGFSDALILSPIQGLGKVGVYGVQHNAISIIGGLINAAREDAENGITSFLYSYATEALAVMLDPNVQGFFLMALLTVAMLIPYVGTFVLPSYIFAQTGESALEITKSILEAPTREKAMQIASSRQVRIFIAVSAVILTMVTIVGFKQFTEWNSLQNVTRYIYDSETGNYIDLLSGKIVLPEDLPWPGNNGFFGTPIETTLTPGTIIDRYGKLSGQYAGIPGTTISARGMASGSEGMTYTRLEVIKPITILSGTAAGVPEFGASGGGLQFYFKYGIQWYIDNGYLRILP